MSLSEYFEKNRPTPKFEIGESVWGYYKGIMFRGSVGNDRMVSEEEGPLVTVHLYLPLKDGIVYRNILLVKHKDLKKSSDQK